MVWAAELYRLQGTSVFGNTVVKVGEFVPGFPKKLCLSFFLGFPSFEIGAYRAAVLKKLRQPIRSGLELMAVNKAFHSDRRLCALVIRNQPETV